MLNHATPTTHPELTAGTKIITADGYVYECAGSRTTKTYGTRLMFRYLADRRGGPSPLYLPAGSYRLA